MAYMLIGALLDLPYLPLLVIFLILCQRSTQQKKPSQVDVFLQQRKNKNLERRRVGKDVVARRSYNYVLTSMANFL
jgi:hypothetical protein